MDYFLDSSVLISAALSSDEGWSRRLIQEASANDITLSTAEYCAAEARNKLANHQRFGVEPSQRLEQLLSKVNIGKTQFIDERPFPDVTSKDRPVVLSALHSGADCLVTNDERLKKATGPNIYGTLVKNAGEVIEQHPQMQVWVEQKRAEEIRLIQEKQRELEQRESPRQKQSTGYSM